MIEEYTRNGLEVKIFADETPESPREWDNLGTMICAHKRYTLGDEQFNPDEFDGWDDLKNHLFKERDAAVVLPLSLYDHSGISMSVGELSGWDSGQVGFIFMTNEVFKANFDYADQEEAIKKAAEVLEGEVKTFDQYLTEDVYGFTVTNPRTGEEIDSCWGFYGIEYTKEEANYNADCYRHPRESFFAKKAAVLHK